MNNLIEPMETKDSVVKCDGGGGQLGHPMIYLNLGKEEKILCPYCSRCFVKEVEDMSGDLYGKHTGSYK